MDKTKLISVSFNSNMISDWLSKTGSTPLFEQIKEHELAKAKSSFEGWFAAQGFESVYITYHRGCSRILLSLPCNQMLGYTEPILTKPK